MAFLARLRRDLIAWRELGQSTLICQPPAVKYYPANMKSSTRSFNSSKLIVLRTVVSMGWTSSLHLDAEDVQCSETRKMYAVAMVRFSKLQQIQLTDGGRDFF